MKHDLEDILDIVKLLEQRLIILERAIEKFTRPVMEDQWYWQH